MSSTDQDQGALGRTAAVYDKAAPPHQRIPTATPDRAYAGPVLRDVMVPMRDGVRLATDVYLPAGNGPFPVILTRLPYGKTEPLSYMAQIADHWARKGYAAVVQDVRGKWGSEGVFVPHVKTPEVLDGTDTIDWTAYQHWSDGRVGMWGDSYYGFTSFAGAAGGHPALRCIAPGDITVDRYRGSFRNGCLQLNTVGNWAIWMNSRTVQDITGVDPRHLPLADMARVAGVDSSYFERLIDNPVRGPFWEERSLLAELEAIRIPTLQWSGWYELYLGCLIEDWRRLRATDPAPGHHHLFIGPWDHEGSADLLHRVGILPVAPGTAAHRWDTYVAFFDRYLMGLDNGFGRRGPVHYYALGADAWRDAQDWPPPEARAHTLYLRGGGHANTLEGDGRLDARPPAADEAADTYVFDPLDSVSWTLGIDCWKLAGDMGDRRPVENRRDVLVYTGEPLDAPLALCGPVTATLHAVSSAVDTDFTVALCDVFPNGSVNLIQDGILRASFRDPSRAPQPLEPGCVYALAVDLWSTSYVVGRGHRLRVEVSSSEFNRYDRNPNTGAPFGREAQPVPARQTIRHDATHPSSIQFFVTA